MLNLTTCFGLVVENNLAKDVTKFPLIIEEIKTSGFSLFINLLNLRVLPKLFLLLKIFKLMLSSRINSCLTELLVKIIKCTLKFCDSLLASQIRFSAPRLII